MNDCTVYTTSFGHYDNFPEGRGVAFLNPVFEAKGWEVREAIVPFKDLTRNARMHKVLSHLFIDTEWSLWTDGAVRWKIDPQEFFEVYKGQGDLIVHKHGARDCLYSEAFACIDLGLDEKSVVESHTARYRTAGFPGSFSGGGSMG